MRWHLGLVAAYDGLLLRHRLKTTSASGAVLAWAGDACTQRATAPVSSSQYDTRRGAAFTLLGGLVTGPVNFVWLAHLDRAVRYVAPGGGMRALMSKLALQSSIFQPFIYLPLFYGCSAAVRSWSFEMTTARMRAEYGRTLRTLWLFWTPCVAFAFGVLPVRQQAVFFAGVGFLWNAVLSFIDNPRTRTEMPQLQTNHPPRAIRVSTTSGAQIPHSEARQSDE